MSYFTLVCLWCGRTVAPLVYGHVITNFLVWVDYLISLALGLCPRAARRGALLYI